MGEFRDATFMRYQQFYDRADVIVQRQVAAGRIANDPMVIGGRMDKIARDRLTGWLNSEGITNTGPGGIIQVNRRLYSAAGSSYRVPDVRIRGANIIFDGTIANSPIKSGLTPQIIDFRAFSGGSNVVIVRPTRLGGSYGIAP